MVAAFLFWMISFLKGDEELQDIDRNSKMAIDDVAHRGVFYCDICDQSDLVPSAVTLEANYGSKYDGERVTLLVCGDCIDWFIESIAEHGGKSKHIASW